MLPNVEAAEDAYWTIKQHARAQNRLRDEPDYEPIEMPRNSPTGFVCAFFATIMGFALIWHIWWLVVVGAVGAYATFVVFAWRDVDEYVISAEEVARIDRANRSARSEALARTGELGMTVDTLATAVPDPYRLGRSEGSSRASGRGEGGPAPKRIVVGYGFWIFLLSDIIMFSAFFAAYAVLSGETAGGPSGRTLFNLHNVAIETGCLLASSFACGIASIAAGARNRPVFYGGMAATFLLGAAFLALEAHEFAGMVARGAGPQRSAFLPSFFTWWAATGCMSRLACCGC